MTGILTADMFKFIVFSFTHCLTFTLPIKVTVSLSFLDWTGSECSSWSNKGIMLFICCIKMRFVISVHHTWMSSYTTPRVCLPALPCWWGYSVFVKLAVGDLWERVIRGPLITARTSTPASEKCIFSSPSYCVVCKMEVFLSFGGQAKALKLSFLKEKEFV